MSKKKFSSRKRGIEFLHRIKNVDMSMESSIIIAEEQKPYIVEWHPLERLYAASISLVYSNP
jgi:hypothetical protein